MGAEIPNWVVKSPKRNLLVFIYAKEDTICKLSLGISFVPLAYRWG